MTSKKLKVMAALSAASLAALVQAPPANALTLGSGVFIGKATVTPALAAPGVNTTLPTTTGPAGVLNGKTGGWTLTVANDLTVIPPLIGVGVAVSDGATTVAGPTLAVTVTGALGGVAGNAIPGLGAWCGLSGGWGGAGTVNVGPELALTTGAPGIGTAVDNVGWATSAATLIVATNAATLVPTASPGTPGTVTTPTLTVQTVGDPLLLAVVSAIPPIPTVTPGSCTNGTAADFTVVGAAVLVDP